MSSLEDSVTPSPSWSDRARALCDDSSTIRPLLSDITPIFADIAADARRRRGGPLTDDELTALALLRLHMQAIKA